jgi:glutamate synthase domain-containing protein 3
VLRVDGGLSTGFDLVAAALLGAEEFGFGKLLLVAEGCIMARVCQKNTCPRGIATQDPKFKKKYRGTKEQVVTLLHYLAEDVRRHLATLGVQRLDQIVGRSDLLELDPVYDGRVKERNLSLAPLLEALPHERGYLGSILDERTGRLNERIVEDARPALREGRRVELAYPVRSTDRAVLATVSGAVARCVQRNRRAGRNPADLDPGAVTVHLTGSAGQGFAAFMTAGLSVTLEGEANDSVGKSMSGGRLVIRPSPDARFHADANAIIGNCAFYGATGGRAYIHGLAGDRFCVRNSGATAVVEGTGLHACEYMTQGRVVILGQTAPNVGAGMTGGTLYLPRDQSGHVNGQYLSLVALDDDDDRELRALLEDYAKATRSRTATAIVEHWAEARGRLIKAIPRDRHLRVVASAPRASTA